MVFGKSWMKNMKASSKEYSYELAGNFSFLIFDKSCYLLLYYKKVMMTSISIF